MRSRLLLSVVLSAVLGGSSGGLTAQPGATLIVRDGLIVTADGRQEADILVRDGVIAEIGVGLEAVPGARELDANGLLIVPGGIDPHVHLGGNWADDFTSGSAAALAGGITTISNFVSPRDGESLGAVLGRTAALARAQTIADFLIHPILRGFGGVAEALPDLAAAGQTSIKVFMSRQSFDADVPGFLGVLRAAGQAGVLTMMHCEDAAILSTTIDRLMADDRGSLRYFPDSRPVVAEEIAVRRAVAMAETTGSPIYVVHLSSARALAVVEEAQARGLPVYVETRPIYLHLTRERFEGDDRGLYVGAPPLREQHDQHALWRGLASGAIHVVATDHVAYTREQKLDPTQTVAEQRQGLNNLQVMLPMLYSEGVVTGRITAERFVALTATNPAKLFGLYPDKGTIAVGSDADLVLWDPEETRPIRDEDALSGAGFSIYAGHEVTGWPRTTIRRGEIVYEDGAITGSAGSGRIAPRTRWQTPTLN